MKRLGIMPHLMFATLLAVLVWPSAAGIPRYLLVLTVSLEVIALLRTLTVSSEEKRRGAGDVAAIVFGILMAWHLATARFGLLDKMLFPPPEAVLKMFVAELPDMLK